MGGEVQLSEFYAQVNDEIVLRLREVMADFTAAG
jgi:hypothetical protein